MIDVCIYVWFAQKHASIAVRQFLPLEWMLLIEVTLLSSFFLLSKKKTAVRLKVEKRHIQGSGTLIRFGVFFSLRSACLYFSLSFSRSCCLLIDYIIISGCFTVLTRGEGSKGTMSLSIERYFCRWLWTSSIILFDDRDAVGVANALMLMITRVGLPQTVALDGWVCDAAHTSFAFSK